LENLAAQKPILDELAYMGYRIETLEGLRYQDHTWKSALPALLRWLTKADNLDVKSAIVRCLSVPWIQGSATAILIDEFRKFAIIADFHRPWRELSGEEIKTRQSSLSRRFSWL
jgi:hypothetical protein